MTNKQINTAIAEACGWSNDDIERGYTLCQFPESVPDYCNDLNAMHEAEKVLTRYQQSVTYSDNLMKIVGYHTFDSAHATARQRAEAFLRTIGKCGVSARQSKKASSRTWLCRMKSRFGRKYKMAMEGGPQ